jgi:hypothetical protein
MVTYKNRIFIITFSCFLTLAALWGFFQMHRGFTDMRAFWVVMTLLVLYTSSLVLVFIKHRLVPIFLRLCASVFSLGSLIGTISLFREGSPFAITLVLLAAFALSVLGFWLVGRYVVPAEEATTFRA